MDPVDRETFTAIRQRVIETAPPGLSREEFNQLLDKELATTQTAHPPGMGDTINGRDPNAAPAAENPLRKMLLSAAYPTSLGDFFGLLLPSAIGEGAVTAPLRAYAKAASAAYQRTGSLATLPVGMLKELYWSAFGKAANGARLVKNPTNEFVTALNELRASDRLNAPASAVHLPPPVELPQGYESAIAKMTANASASRREQLLAAADRLASRARNSGGRLAPKSEADWTMQILNEARATDTLNAPAEMVGTAAGKTPSPGVNVNPATVSTRSGPMTATLPDKFGQTALQAPDLARVAPNSAWTTSKLPTREQIENLRQLLLHPMADKDPVLRAQIIEAINALKGTK